MAQPRVGLCWSRKCSLKCAVHTGLGTSRILSCFPWKNFITLTPPGLCWPQPYREAAVLPTGQILGIQGMEGHRGCNGDTPLWPGMLGICSGPALGIREPPENPQAPTAHAQTPQFWPWILLSLLNSPCPSPWLWRESRNAGDNPKQLGWIIHHGSDCPFDAGRQSHLSFVRHPSVLFLLCFLFVSLLVKLM